MAASSTDPLAAFLSAAAASNQEPSHASEAWRATNAPPEFGRPPITNSEDLERVIALARRPQVNLSRDGQGKLHSPVAQALLDFMNAKLRRPDWQRTNCKCASLNRKCITTLQPAQAWALYELMLVGGLLGLLATGSGKTAVGFLSPLVLNCPITVGLVPANLTKQLANEYILWREHWLVPTLVLNGVPHSAGNGVQRVQDSIRAMSPRTPWPTLHIVSYQQLSQPTSTTLLADLNPDFVYADEMDKLADMTSARTIRFCRQFAALPKTRFGGWTGTPWDKSIMEVTHCAAFALRGGSPLPLEPAIAREWAVAIDPSDRPAQPGALRKLCGPQAGGGPPGEELQDGFHRRLVETLGVVATQESAIDIPLNLYERDPGDIPSDVEDMLSEVRAFRRPDGEELVDALEVARVIQEVGQGFYYKWVFPTMPRGPDGKLTQESKTLILQWLADRKAWRKELRLKIHQGEPHLDSERLCLDAAERHYTGYQGELPIWESRTYKAWVAIKDLVQPETEAVWVSDYLVEDAIAWAREHRGIVWYKHTTFGERVARLGDFPLHSGGPHAEDEILAEKGDRSIVASMDSHGRGRDGLQYLYHEQLVVVPPASGRKVEQLLARLHRVGQVQPLVNTWGYRHIEEYQNSFDQAFRRAAWAGGTWGTNQKLLSANCEWRQ